MASKTVLITGASRGIGASCAERFAEAGFRVLLHANRHEREARRLAGKIRAAELYLADFAQVSQLESFCRTLSEERVDVLVNNAGISHSALFQETDDDALFRVVQVDLLAPMRIARALIPSMVRKQSGAIVNVASIWGQTGASMEVAYSAAKAGLIGFTKALSKELGPSSVRVNCVCPGVIDTDMMREYDENSRSMLCEQTPLCRLGTAGEVAECVYFLASDAASYVTGQVLSPNGGMYI